MGAQPTAASRSSRRQGRVKMATVRVDGEGPGFALIGPRPTSGSKSKRKCRTCAEREAPKANLETHGAEQELVWDVCTRKSRRRSESRVGTRSKRNRNVFGELQIVTWPFDSIA